MYTIISYWIDHINVECNDKIVMQDYNYKDYQFVTSSTKIYEISKYQLKSTSTVPQKWRMLCDWMPKNEFNGEISKQEFRNHITVLSGWITKCVQCHSMQWQCYSVMYQKYPDKIII